MAGDTKYVKTTVRMKRQDKLRVAIDTAHVDSHGFIASLGGNVHSEDS